MKQIEAKGKEEINKRFQSEVGRLMSKMKALSEKSEQESRMAEKVDGEVHVIEGGCMHPRYDLRDRSRCFLCKELIHNACANKWHLKDEAMGKIYCSQACFKRVAI